MEKRLWIKFELTSFENFLTLLYRKYDVKLVLKLQVFKQKIKISKFYILYKLPKLYSYKLSKLIEILKKNAF